MTKDWAKGYCNFTYLIHSIVIKDHSKYRAPAPQSVDNMKV